MKDSGMSESKKATPKRPPGRPITKTMPAPIPDTLENVARAIMQTPPKPKGEWRYIKDR